LTRLAVSSSAGGWVRTQPPFYLCPRPRSLSERGLKRNEDLTSADVNVICYKEVSLSNDLNISAQNIQGVKGLVKVFNTSGDAIVGIIRTQELIPTTNGFLRGYAYSMYDDRTADTSGFFEEGAGGCQ
jgi:hypothetical protein